MLSCLLALITFSTASNAAYRDYSPLEIDTRDFTTVTGYVEDQFNHIKINGAIVTLNGVGGAQTRVETTDFSGFYKFTELNDVDYPLNESTITVTHEGYTDSESYSLESYTMADIELESRTVILVHGVLSSFQGGWGGYDGVFATELSNNSFNVIGFDAGGFPSNILYVSDIEMLLFSTLQAQCHLQGIQSYDIVAHSMGGLVSRYYLTKSYGRNRIDKLVMLGTPNHGSYLANHAHRTALALDFALEHWSGGLCCFGIVEYVADQTAMRDLKHGSDLLNSLNHNTSSWWPAVCPSSFNENSDNGSATLYSIAGTDPTGWFKASRAVLGCWGQDADGVVLKSRAFYHDGYTCTDEGLGCGGTHHKTRGDGLKDSECLAKKVTQLLLNNTFNCNMREEKAEDGVMLSQLPAIEGGIPLGGSYQDSTQINAMTFVDFLCMSGADSLIYTLETPSGQIIDPDECVTNPDMEYIRNRTSAYYSIQYPETGVWKHNMSAVNSTEAEPIYLMTSFDGNVSLGAITSNNVSPDSTFVVEAVFTDADYPIPTGTVNCMVTHPGGSTESIELYDDGFAPDPVAGDGHYFAELLANGEEGDFHFLFNAVTDPASPYAEVRESMTISSAAWLPNLVITEPGLVADTLEPPLGSLLNMSASFTNNGDAVADSVQVLISNVSFGATLVDTMIFDLTPGATVEFDAEWLAASEGEFVLQASANIVGDGFEQSTIDNMSQVLVTVHNPGSLSFVPDYDPDNELENDSTTRVLLYNNFPNPLSGSGTSIRFVVPAEGMETEVAIFDIKGRRVKTVLSENMPRGEYIRIWDGKDRRGSDVASGIYFYRLQVGETVRIKKLVVIR